MTVSGGDSSLSLSSSADLSVSGRLSSVVVAAGGSSSSSVSSSVGTSASSSSKSLGVMGVNGGLVVSSPPKSSSSPTGPNVANIANIANVVNVPSSSRSSRSNSSSQPTTAHQPLPPSGSLPSLPSLPSIPSIPILPGLPSLPSIPVVAAAVTMKTKQEIQTSLHLIKDIRRLESYQRDFFLKVKESLNAVQMLLEHQLMDMTWSESLNEVEENLLQTALQLTNVTPSQVSDIYGNLLRDRDSLNQRFSELLSKSSLSEFIVNSGHILDINTVRAATEAILKHEKPIRPKQDKSVPIDHTFFLANFCVSSLASGMMFRSPSGGVSVGGVGSKLMSGVDLSQHHHQQHQQIHDNPPPSTTQIHHPRLPQQQQHPVALSPSPAKKASSYVGAGEYLVNGGGVPAGEPPALGSSSDRYGNGKVPSLMDAVYTSADFSATAEAFVPSAQNDGFVSGGPSIYGQELVTAITQIAYQDENKKHVSPPPAGSNNSQPPKTSSTTNPWQKVEAGSSSSDNYFGAVNGFVNQSSVIPPPSSSANAVDVSSDSVSNTSTDDGRGDASKPLSFARIASLNLEKQVVGGRGGGVLGAMSVGPIASNGHHLQQQQTPPLLTNLHGHAGGSSFGNTSSSSSSNSFEHHQRQVAHQAAVIAVVQQQQQQHSSSLMLPSPHTSLPASLNPRFYLDIVMEGKKLGRVIIEVEPLVAPKMAQNFQMLVTGEKGFGYRGCHFFQAWKNESVICGDWEHNSGRGGRAAFEGGTLFTPDDTKLPCIRGAVGMRRMSKKHSTLNQVASQFRIILANMHTQFSGIFGHVVSGIEALDKVANVGGEGGRPEKIASVQNCGIYKQ